MTVFPYEGWQVDGNGWQVGGRLGGRLGEAYFACISGFFGFGGRYGNFFKNLRTRDKRAKAYREKKRRIELTIGTTCHTCHPCHPCHASDAVLGGGV
jgi:hypothetical protein